MSKKGPINLIHEFQQPGVTIRFEETPGAWQLTGNANTQSLLPSTGTIPTAVSALVEGLFAKNHIPSVDRAVLLNELEAALTHRNRRQEQDEQERKAAHKLKTEQQVLAKGARKEARLAEQARSKKPEPDES